MRIGILTHNFPRNSKDRQDAGIFLYDFAKELSKKHEVFVLCPNFKGEKEKFKDVSVTWFDWSGGDQKLGNFKIYDPKSLWNFLSLMYQGTKIAPKFAKKNKLDFCIAAWAFPSGVFAAAIKKDLKIPYATWSLGSDINQYAEKAIFKQIILSVLKNANIRFSNSYAICEKVEALSGKNCEFLPAITNFEHKNIEKPNISNRYFNFLYVGRLEIVKGPDILIDASKKLFKQNKKFRLYVIGPGSLDTQLQQEAQKAKLKNNVIFLGQQGAREIAGYMSVSDFLVIPSRNESLPLVMIEAAKMGLPMIATKVGDCAKVIADYNIGISVERENSSALARAMGKVIKEKKQRKFKAGLVRLTEDFVLKNSVKQFMSYIK